MLLAFTTEIVRNFGAVTTDNNVACRVVGEYIYTGWFICPKTWVGLTLIWVFHHLAQLHSHFCQIPISPGRIGLTVNTQNPIYSNPGIRADESPCTDIAKKQRLGCVIPRHGCLWTRGELTQPSLRLYWKLRSSNKTSFSSLPAFLLQYFFLATFSFMTVICVDTSVTIITLKWVQGFPDNMTPDNMTA